MESVARALWKPRQAYLRRGGNCNLIMQTREIFFGISQVGSMHNFDCIIQFTTGPNMQS